MRNYKTLALLSALLLGSCQSADDTTGGGPESTYVGYRYVNTFATGEECDNLIQYGINCSQWLLLADEERAEIMVTDIVNIGLWAEHAGTIETTWSESGDVVPAIVFTKQAASLDLVDGEGTVWRQEQP